MTTTAQTVAQTTTTYGPYPYLCGTNTGYHCNNSIILLLYIFYPYHPSIPGRQQHGRRHGHHRLHHRGHHQQPVEDQGDPVQLQRWLRVLPDQLFPVPHRGDRHNTELQPGRSSPAPGSELQALYPEGGGLLLHTVHSHHIRYQPHHLRRCRG